MAESIGAVRVDIVGNAEDLKVEVQRAKTLVASMGPEFEKSYAKMNESQKRATLATLKFEQTIGKSRDEIKLLSLAARGAAPEALEKLRLSMLRTRDAAGSTNTLLGAQSKAFAGSNKTARELQFAMRGLPAQITDIGVSLASGQRPMMVFLQQGGQLKDLFGGIRPAAAALATAIRGLINPLTLAAAAVGVFGLALKSASDDADELNKAIILTGNYAGTSFAELEQMATRVAEAADASTGSAKDAIAQVAATGRFTSSEIEKISTAALRMRSVTGKAISETIAEFVRIADDPGKAIESLNKSQHLLADSTVEQVKALEDQGEKAKAAATAISDVADATINRAGKVEEHLSTWASIWLDIKRNSSEAGSAMKDAIVDTDGALQDMLGTMAKIGINPLAVIGFGYVGNKRQRAARGTDFGNVQSQASTVSGDPTEQVLADIAALEQEIYGPAAIEAHNRRAEAWVKAGEAAKRALKEQERAAKEAERAMERLNREDERMEAVMRAREDAKSRAIESWAELTAQLDGPVALAYFRHKQELLDIAEAGKAAGASADDIAAAQRRATEAYEQTTPAALAAAEAQKRAIEEAARISRSLQFATEDMFASFIDGSESASEAIENFGKAVLRIAARVLAERAVTALFNLFNPGYNFNPANYSDRGGLAGMGNFDLPVRNAKGGVYASRDLSKFSGKVYDSPQLFKFARGAGIFGEAGPEAIMPLKRGADGKLGVQASGAAGPQQINIRIVGAPSQPEARAVPNDSGGFDLELVFKQLEPRLASSMMRRGSPMGQAVEARIRSMRGVPVSS